MLIWHLWTLTLPRLLLRLWHIVSLVSWIWSVLLLLLLLLAHIWNMWKFAYVIDILEHTCLSRLWWFWSVIDSSRGWFGTMDVSIRLLLQYLHHIGKLLADYLLSHLRVLTYLVNIVCHWVDEMNKLLILASWLRTATLIICRHLVKLDFHLIKLETFCFQNLLEFLNFFIRSQELEW